VACGRPEAEDGNSEVISYVMSKMARSNIDPSGYIPHVKLYSTSQ